MSILKSAIKMGTAHDIGCKLDDQLEAATREIDRIAGASQGANSVAKKLGSLVAAIQKDIDDGALKMPDDPLHLGGMLIHQIKRAIVVAESESKSFAKMQLQQEGLARGLRTAVSTVQKVHDIEAGKSAKAEEKSQSKDEARDERRKEMADRKKPKKAAKKKSAKKPARKAAKKKASKKR